MTINDWNKVKSYLKEISYLEYTASLLDWDLKVNSPEEGGWKKEEIYSYIKTQAFNKFISDRFGELLEAVDISSLSPIEQKIYKNIKENYKIQKAIPAPLYERLQKTTAKAYPIWVQAKKENNFAIFSPLLEELVTLTKEIASNLNGKDNYESLLNLYEPELSLECIKNISEKIKDFLIPWIEIHKNNFHVKLPEITYPIESQEKFVNQLLEKINFNKKQGRVDVTIHPFTTVVGPKDVRITTKYTENEPLSAIFGVLHEAGHGLFEQNKDAELYWLISGIRYSYGVHEAQSRFWENIIGRSPYFWDYFYPILQDLFPELKSLSLKSFVKIINKIEPSLIRIEADEVTYNLHIILRLEIEEKLINSKLTVKELPEVWNNTIKKYLGVTPKNDSEGVLQDVHWSQGYFGYFPSYMLGNLYGAQILKSLKSDLPDMEQKLSKGIFSEINSWFNEKVYRWGLIETGPQLLKRITGEELNPIYWIEYIKDKFSKILY